MSDTREQVNDAIASAIANNGDMIVRWVAAIEGIDSDGSRYLWLMADDSSTAWDRLGMYQFALTQEQADVTCDNCGGD